MLPGVEPTGAGTRESSGTRPGPAVRAAAGAAGAALAVWGHAADQQALFWGALALLAGVCGACSLAAARRGRGAAVAAWNTGIALAVGLAVVEVFLRVGDGAAEAVPPPPVYTFADARADPAAFRRWAEAYLAEWERTRRFYLMEDPRGVNPMVLRPGSRFRFFESPHRINAQGFRGEEIASPKGGRYRIVALGESTTFGATLRADDRPWPAVLEARIARELACEAPVEVVNAGIPGWTLANNLARLDADIWPLDPDLLLSYHGYNGFPYLIQALPSLQVGRAPRAPERPSALLRRVEQALRVAWFRRRFRAAQDVDASVLETDLHATRYAELYRELVFEARRHGVPLVLATFNLAVTPGSPEPVLAFYEEMFPDVRARALANRLHNRLVREIGEAYDVPVVDTSPGLDGAWSDAYIDPMHLTQTGRDRLAAHWLDGLRPRLAAEAGCRPRGDASADAAPADPRP